ncbi:type I-E CRISPR-associated protein Cas6/Cse3/CasE [Novosphingobium sp. FSW06-99]|uniref:type I-E CRISPR-associated protein Cas6/Cse3/CasE n=1 Tax=Novosphingobium sp. FSW06-99 TaxID=1739113 RepID=UPI000B0138D8|nr:type I-E CRISPR-associated protein Cas6/Cse3/CasE [Novosphingobium sp. FSW06-99]
MSRYLSRLTLRRDPALDALRALLQPDDAGRLLDANHRLVWAAFAGDPDVERDFLWRAEGEGRFLVLSARAPVESALFEPHAIKPFAPVLNAGDRLHFSLRANATRARAMGQGVRGQRVDVVMDALHRMGAVDRAIARDGAAHGAALDWMAGQGADHGFHLANDQDGAPVLSVVDYAVMAIPGHSGRRRGQPQFGVLDLAGTLVVDDPAAFVAKLARGFGRARAFGCGLMLIRRAGG